VKKLNRILVYLSLKDKLNFIGNGNKEEELKSLFYFTGKRSYLLRGKNKRQNRVFKKQMKERKKNIFNKIKNIFNKIK
jgi:hypothetical protein